MQIQNKQCSSVNMDLVFYNELVSASETFGKSKQKIFKDLVFLILQNSSAGNNYGLLTEYQNHCPEGWTTFYFSLNLEESEVFSIAKQNYKLSLSKLAFISFILFWKSLLIQYSYVIKICIYNIDFHSYDQYNYKAKFLAKTLQNRIKIIKRE